VTILLALQTTMRNRLTLAAFVPFVLAAAPLAASPLGFSVTTLATNATDANLINPWGMASTATSPIWIAANGSGTSVVYNGLGVKQALTVTIPGAGSVTGVAFSMVPGAFNGDVFLFASEDGTVSGWRGALGTSAEVLQSPGSDVYKGMATASVGGHGYAYLANFATGAVDVLKGDAGAPDLAGNFTDPNLPSGYAPFDVQVLGGQVFVTYAVKNGTDDTPGPGNGLVDVFDLNGNLLRRLVTGGLLNSPWGLAIAPAGFGGLDGNLLVGNFGDGRINAYDPLTGMFVATLTNANSQPITLDGLWGLRFGNGGNGGDLRNLYFTAGPAGETGGVFGVIQPNAVTPPAPEPATLVLVGAGLLGALLRRRR
jgi:uncharacterized protein (TIGR03118 family)